MSLSVKEILFVDVEGQKFHFALDADDAIYSLVLGPKRAHGIQTLFVNGDEEQYKMHTRDILEALFNPVDA